MKITIILGKKVGFLLVIFILIHFLHRIIQNSNLNVSLDKKYTNLNNLFDTSTEVKKVILNKNIHSCISNHLDQKITASAEKELTSYQKANCYGKSMPLCKNDKLVGGLYVDRSIADENILRKEIPYAKHGGWWRPPDCKEIAQTAIIIPFRNREPHLQILLRQLHPILYRQNLHYRIFVIDQVDNFSFNRAKLLNVGFVISQAFFPYSCFVFHDVDMIPENDQIDYGCKTSPTHSSVAVDKFGYQLLYKTLIGGVEMFSRNDFLTVNGFSNSFWYWGGEDDNLYQRLQQKKLTLQRPSIDIGRYTMIKHADSTDREKHNFVQRREFLSKTEAFTDIDGLNTLHYDVVNILENEFYTHIKVNLTKNLDEKHFQNMFGIESDFQ